MEQDDTKKTDNKQPDNKPTSDAQPINSNKKMNSLGPDILWEEIP